MIEKIIKKVSNQISNMNNLDFHKYYLENFIIKNKETGKEILSHFKVKDMDNLFIKLKTLY